MKLLISHSSKNANYGNALVDLLVNVGVNSEQIIFTSNDAFGIPTGQNIFNWLKNRITEKPHVIYLLSTAYYSSVACLNEMGAAWVVENEHTIIFTPEFKTSSYEFQNGALDPREMGFYITNLDRITAFIESLRGSFPISTNTVFVGQKVRDFIQKVSSFEQPKVNEPIEKMAQQKPLENKQEQTGKSVVVESLAKPEPKPPVAPVQISTAQAESHSAAPNVKKFLGDLAVGKLKDEEILLIHYSMDTAKFKLGTGWQESHEIDSIRIWEDVNELRGTLSSNYAGVLRRLDVKKLVTVSEVTGHGNPKELTFVPELKEVLIEFPDDLQTKIDEALARNVKISWEKKEDDLPF